jgi:hypothetical protein
VTAAVSRWDACAILLGLIVFASGPIPALATMYVFLAAGWAIYDWRAGPVPVVNGRRP